MLTMFLPDNQEARYRGLRMTADDYLAAQDDGHRYEYDHETKKGDYEHCGVREYWLVDPEKREFVFYRLEDGRYIRVSPSGDTFASQIIPGFELDLRQVGSVFG